MCKIKEIYQITSKPYKDDLGFWRLTAIIKVNGEIIPHPTIFISSKKKYLKQIEIGKKWDTEFWKDMKFESIKRNN